VFPLIYYQYYEVQKMSKSNVKTEETVRVVRGDFVCLLNFCELKVLSNALLRQLSGIYSREVQRFIHLDQDYTLSGDRKISIDPTYIMAVNSCCCEINRILDLRKAQHGVCFFDQDCDVLVEKYSNGTTSLRLFSDGPVATATVCLPEVLLPEGYVLIKDYDENAGVLAALVFSGIVKDTGQTYPVGRFNHANFCRLTL
jgi:hypothetical protein